MSDYIVNILPVCTDYGKAALFDECLAGLSTATSIDTWYEHKRMFDVIVDGHRIVLSGGKIHLRNFEISIINEDYPQDRTQIDDWMKKFNLLVLCCDARALSNYRDRVAIIRNTMHSRGRSSDAFLFLTHICDVMNITDMPTEQQTLMGIYSALSPEPSCTTELKKSYSGCFLDSSYWLDQHFSRYHDKTRHCYFQLPRGVICGYGLYSGYCDLLLTIIRCGLYQKNIVVNKSIGHPILINRDNHQLKINENMNILQSLLPSRWTKKRQDKKTIRLAVVGDTASGKTFFLQDFCQSLSKLKFNYIDRSQFPFSTHSDFKGDIHDVGYGRTPNYACQQRNHYVGDYINSNREEVRIEFLDIPGDIFELESGQAKRMDTCGRIIQWLNGSDGPKEKWFTVTPWNCGERVIKIVTFNSECDNGSKSADSEEKNNTKKNINNHTNEIRIESYEPFSVYLGHLIECGYKKDEENTYQINGSELLSDFFSYDAHSTYYAMKSIYNRVSGRLNGINENQYSEYVKSLYFFVFLYHATDIVLCQICPDPRGGNGETVMSIMGKLSDFYTNVEREKQRYYLAFKGSDNFMKPKESKELFLGCARDLNGFYSIFTAQINQCLYGPNIQDANNVFDGENQFISENEKRFRIENSIIEILDIEKIPGQVIRDCIYAFRTSLLRQNAANLIPPHVYFCATPIDYEFSIDIFGNADKQNENSVKGKTINGRSLEPQLRVCFGTAQLVMDILENMKDKSFFLYGGESEYSQPGKIIRYLQDKLI